MIALLVKSLPQRGVKKLKSGTNLIQIASITGRGTRGGPLQLPKPFPYKTKRLMWYNRFIDNSMLKFSQENARVIVVEGPIGVGKTAFCKTLAEEFDMYYLPQPTMDKFYVLPSGYDLRQHDHEVPESARTYDHRNFCMDPHNTVKAARFQVYMLFLRFHHYLDGLTHLFNTGQGVILERSYFSDFVFMKAMLENNYVSKAAYNSYEEIRLYTSTIPLPPHLVIYLDIPVPVVQERIRTRNYSYEQGSPALTTEYLQSLEKYWKQEYLNQARQRSELLVYDWTDGGDVEVVVDDIEKIDFNVMRRDKKFKDWWLRRSALLDKRVRVTVCRHHYSKLFRDVVYASDELFVPFEEELLWQKIMLKIPECKYVEGYNRAMGDSLLKILFSSKEVHPMDQRYFWSSVASIHD